MTRKTVLITGAGTGIGKDTALALVKNGHKVIATTHHEEEVASLGQTLGENATVFKLDICDPNDRAKINDLNFNVLINNAAIGESGSLAEIDINKVKKVFEVNVFSAISLSQIAIKKMIKGDGGTIIFISSITGRIPSPFLMPYSMSKFAISAAAAGLREEMQFLDKNIHVSVVEPGPYHTGFNQNLSGSRFEWMRRESIFTPQQIEKMEHNSNKQLRLLESKTTTSIVGKIIAATEAKKPRLRYVAPWHVALLVRLLRIFGV